LADSFGRTEFDLELSCSVEWGERKVQAVMGGPMAEYRYRGKDHWDVLNRRRLKGSDRKWIHRQMGLIIFLDCGCGGLIESGDFSLERHERLGKPAYLEPLRRRAAKALEARWPDIQTVARELERSRSLDGDAVDALISGA